MKRDKNVVDIRTLGLGEGLCFEPCKQIRAIPPGVDTTYFHPNGTGKKPDLVEPRYSWAQVRRQFENLCEEVVSIHAR